MKRKLTIITSVIIVVLAVGWACPAHGLSGDALYVCNFGGTDVSVISVDTMAVTRTIPVGRSPASVVITPDGTRAYVCNNASDTVSVIDTETDTVLTNIPVGRGPWGATLSRDARRLYVINQLANSVSVVDTAPNSVLTTFPTRPEPTVIAYHPTRDEIWIGFGSASLGGVVLEVRSGLDYSVLATLSSGTRLYGTDLAFSPSGNELFAAESCGACGRFHRLSGDYSDGQVVVLQHDVLYDGTGGGISVAFHPATGQAYLGKPARIQEYPSGRTLSFAAVPWDIAVSPDGQRLFVANYATNGFVSVVDTSTLTTIGTVNVGVYPTALAFKLASVSLSIAVTDIQVCWGSRSNVLYQLEYRSDLTTNLWRSIGSPQMGNGSTVCVGDSVLGDPKRFYRVRELQ